MLTLSIHDLNVMKNEFREAYTNLFENSFTNLRRAILVKLKAIRYSNKYLSSFDDEKGYKSFTKLQDKNINQRNYKDLDFDPINQSEIEDGSSDFCSSSDSDENGDAKVKDKGKQADTTKKTFKEYVYKSGNNHFYNQN